MKRLLTLQNDVFTCLFQAAEQLKELSLLNRVHDKEEQKDWKKGLRKEERKK